MLPPEKKLTRRRVVVLALFLFVLTALTVWRLGTPWGVESGIFMEKIAGETMGTTYHVTLITDEALEDNYRDRIAAQIADELAAVNRLMSTYDPDSEISRFNAADHSDPFPVSPATLEVLEYAQRVSVESDGAFDVTVAPLVAAWGFGAGASITPPEATELAALREQVGYDKIILDLASKSVRKTAPAVRIDLSAIAKGYGVDQVAELLDARGFENYLVEIGGEVRTRGTNQNGLPWQVAIERPVDGGRAIQRIVPLSGQSMATSGDYRVFYERDGRRFSHTVDPRTGRPIEHDLASVSVIHTQCAFADAYATALNVLGPEEGVRLAETLDLPALFIVRREDGFEEFATSLFKTRYK